MADVNALLDPLLRWVHLVSGILWVGLLYFFNWVQNAFASTLDDETRRKVAPELLPRILYWFRWAAVWTWVTGFVLLNLLYYHGGLLLDSPDVDFGVVQGVMIALIFLAVLGYDGLMKRLGPSNARAAALIGYLLIAALILLMIHWARFSYRAWNIHIGAMFGTIMAFNAWFRIWPAQRRIITAIKQGESPDPAAAALAGMRSRQNTYLSVPLLFTMINHHHVTWSGPYAWIVFLVLTLCGWTVVSMLYRKAGKVPGF
jgi:uncharacterized membrane protein